VDPTDGFANEIEDRALPFVDEHMIKMAASRELVWSALQRYVVTSLRIAEGNPLRGSSRPNRPPAAKSPRAGRPNA